MTIDILTLFPDMFRGPFDESILRRAQDKRLVSINLHNLRTWAIDERGTVDDHPYGGGTGMLLRPEPIFNAVEEINNLKLRIKNNKIVLLDAGGQKYNQKKALEYSKLEQLILICGHYEGVDYRVHEYLADEVISIGDFVLTGGEIPAIVVVDSIVRLIPGVLNKTDATEIESFSSNRLTTSAKGRSASGGNDQRLLLEFPQYTRPEEFHGHKVPEIVRNGNHAKIEEWRKEQALKRTKQYRPDLLGKRRNA